MRTGIEQLGEYLAKSAGHKYTQRSGSPGHYQYTYDQPQGGQAPAQVGQTQSGHPLHLAQRGPHSVQGWGEVLVTKTSSGHEDQAPRHLEHEGKHWVRAGYNTDSNTVGYHEYQPQRHVMDASTGFAREALQTEGKGGNVPGGLFHLAGLPEDVGGDLPREINDPHHGKLTVRGHNSDSGFTLYHKDVLNPGWNKGSMTPQPASAPQAAPVPQTPLTTQSKGPAAQGKPPPQQPEPKGQPAQAPQVAKPLVPSRQAPTPPPSAAAPKASAPPTASPAQAQPAPAAPGAGSAPAPSPPPGPQAPQAPKRQPLGKSLAMLGDWLEKAERIPGGLASGKAPADFDPKALAQGQRVEMEHTDDPKIAQEIAMDHLTEDPRYYGKLARMESDLSKSGHKYLRRTGTPGHYQYTYQHEGEGPGARHALEASHHENMVAYAQARKRPPADSDTHAAFAEGHAHMAEAEGYFKDGQHADAAKHYSEAAKRFAAADKHAAGYSEKRDAKEYRDHAQRFTRHAQMRAEYAQGLQADTARKSMEHTIMATGLEALGAYLQKSVEAPMPQRDCALGYGKSQDQGGSPDGGSLEGKERGFVGDRVGNAKDPEASGGKPGAEGIGAPAVPEKALNAEERSPERQMAEGKTALEEDGEDLSEKSLTPASQRAMVAREHAVRVAEMTKSTDVRVGSPDHPYMMSSYGDVDAATESLLKSQFYQGGQSPTLAPPGTVIRGHVLCKSEACGCSYPAFLTACPECSEGQTRSRLLPQAGYIGGGDAVNLEKSVYNPLLRQPPVVEDLLVGEPENPVVRRHR